MISSALARSVVSTTATGAAKPRGASLDAELATARAQLGDWITCPSRKTPEGKAKIETFSAKVEAIKSKMAATEAARQARSEAAHPSEFSPVSKASGSAMSLLGSHVDTYA